MDAQGSAIGRRTDPGRRGRSAPAGRVARLLSARVGPGPVKPHVLDVADGNSHAPKHEMLRNIDLEGPFRGSNRPQCSFSISALQNFSVYPAPFLPRNPLQPRPPGLLAPSLEKANS